MLGKGELRAGMTVAAQLHIFDLNLMTSVTFLQLEQKLGVDSDGLFGLVLIILLVSEASRECHRMRRLVYT